MVSHWCDSPPPPKQVPTTWNGVVILVISVDILVNQIALLGKNFPWRKPSCCPRCGSGLWWHGFVLAWFEPLDQAVFIRRLRCPACHSVHRLRPRSYWPRCRSPIEVVKSVLGHRHLKLSWLDNIPLPRQKIWWHRFRRHAASLIGINWQVLPDPFMVLTDWGRMPVSSTI